MTILRTYNAVTLVTVTTPVLTDFNQSGAFDFRNGSAFAVASESTLTLKIYRWMGDKWRDTGFTVGTGASVVPDNPDPSTKPVFSAGFLMLGGGAGTVFVDVKG